MIASNRPLPLVIEETAALAPPAGIEFRHLRYFLAVFDELHFGRAAERLHIAQPALSQAIRKLEHELGVDLFVRTSRTVEPTKAGIALAEEARRAVASFEFAVSEARSAADPDAPLRIGCVTFLPNVRLQLFLRELQKHDATLRAEVAHLHSPQQVEALRSGRLDLGLFMLAEEYPGLEHEPLFPAEPIVAFMASGHPLAAKQVVRPEDVANETLLTYPRTTNPEMYDRYMARYADAGFRFLAVHETGADPRDVLHALASGLGVALTLESFRLISEDHGVVARPLEPSVLSFPDMSVAWHANAPRRLRGRLESVRRAAREVYAATTPAA